MPISSTKAFRTPSREVIRRSAIVLIYVFLARDGRFIGMDGFGASAVAETLYEHFGITPAAVAAAAGR
jgi:transketolase